MSVTELGWSERSIHDPLCDDRITVATIHSETLDLSSTTIVEEESPQNSATKIYPSASSPPEYASEYSGQYGLVKLKRAFTRTFFHVASRGDG